ncbi:phage polarity suppression protein, partial [Enterobacter hormaechei]
MTPLTLEQAFEVCQNTKTAWLTRKQELADTEQEYRELIATGDDSRTRSLQTL